MPLGKPKSDIERVMTHYNVSEKKAKEMLKKKSVDDLLPERGTGRANVINMDIAVSNVINGLRESAEKISKRTFLRQLYKAVERYTKGFHRDSGWQDIKRVWSVFDKMGLDWNLGETYYGKHKYDNTVPPESKTWHFEIRFINDRGNKDKIRGTLTAHGAGSVAEPLEKYDITVVMS